MKSDSLKLIFSYLTAMFLIAGAYYALVLYEYELSADVKLWLTASAGGAIAFVFGDQIATRSRINTKNDIMTSSPLATTDAAPSSHPDSPIG